MNIERSLPVVQAEQEEEEQEQEQEQEECFICHYSTHNTMIIIQHNCDNTHKIGKKRNLTTS